jgi:hypothetical protein
VNIRFTSSLTPEDEHTLAPALLTALGAILDLLPIAYAIRIETADSRVFHRDSVHDEPPLQDNSLRMRVASPFGGPHSR